MINNLIKETLIKMWEGAAIKKIKKKINENNKIMKTKSKPKSYNE